MLTILLMVACKTYEVGETVTIDTVGITTIERDTMVFTPLVKSSVIMRVDSLADIGEVTKTKDHATVKVIYKDNYVYVDCTCDSLAHEITIRDKLIESLKTVKKNTVRVDKETVIPWLNRIMGWIGLVALIILIIKRKRIWA